MKQIPSTPPLDNMICFSVYAAGLAFNRLYRDLLNKFGLTYSQFLVLVAINQKGSVNVTELGEALFLESNTLTPLLKRMEAAGLVTRLRSKSDEREVLIGATKLGAKLGRDIGCVPPQVLQATHMKVGDVSSLTANLNRLAENLREHTSHNN